MVEKVKTVEINYFCSSYLFWNTNGWCKKAVLDVVDVVVKKNIYIFLTSASLLKMKRRHEIMKFACSVCTFTCQTLNGLKRHKLACKRPTKRIIRSNVSPPVPAVEAAEAVDAG